MRGSEHSAKVTRRLHWIAHIGYASRGLLFLSIGILALLAAVDSHRQTVGWTGALRVLGQSFGTPLLAVLLLGLIFFSVWRILQAYLDMDGLGDKPLALAKRVVFAITGIFYSLAALWILWVLFGFAADKSEDALLRHWTYWGATCKTAGSRRIFHSEREQIVASALTSRMVFPQRNTSRTGARTCLYARRYQTPGITFKDSFSRCCGKR